MDLPETRFRPDWPSRVLAIVSLLLAGLAVGYVVLQNQVSLSRDTLVTQFKETLEDQAKLQEGQVAQRLDEVVESATSRLQQQEAAFTQMLASQKEELDKLVASYQPDFQSLRTQWQQDIAAQLAGTQSGPQPHLTFRPVTHGGHRIQIENPTSAPITVDGVIFRPTRDIEASELDLTAATDDSGENPRRTVVFSPADNQAKDPSRHGAYHKKLDPPIVVPAGGSQVVSFQIENAEHLGWALEGNVRFLTGNRELLAVQNVPVPFTAP